MRRHLTMRNIVAAVAGAFLMFWALWGQAQAEYYHAWPSFTEAADSMYTVSMVGVPPALDDSSAGVASPPAGISHDSIEITVGNYYEIHIRYRWESTDDWLSVLYSTFNSASAGTLTKGDVFDTLMPIYQDSGHLFIGGAGSGSNQVTFVTLSAGDSSAIGGVAITLSAVDGGAVQYQPIVTSTLGLKTVGLSADSFLVETAAIPYLMTYDTIVVSATQSDTIFLTAFDPEAPADSAYCRCWFHISSLRNHPTFGVYLGTKGVQVCFTPLYRVHNSCNNTWSTAGPFCEATDSVGYVYVDLVWSSCLLKGDNPVQYKLEIDKKIAIEAFTVPDSASYKVF